MADGLSEGLLPGEHGSSGWAEEEVMVAEAPIAAANLFRDVDVDGPDMMTSDLLGESRVVKKGSITGTGQDRLDIEDALDRIGGVSWFQLVHFCACGVFWFSQPAVLFSIFANGPCRGGGAVCTTPDGGVDGRGACCSEWDPASIAAGHGGCVLEEPEGIGVCAFAGPGPEPDGTQPYWSNCRSVSCQFNLGSEAGRGVFRELFDSSFFAGWMWAVPVWGFISDNFGRRTALWLALAALHIGQFASALSPNVWTYLVARHFTGIGAGCTSLTSFMIGTEYSPTSRSTAIKGGWSYWSLFGGIAQSFGAKALFMYLPGYNWRLLTLIMSAPLLLWTLPAYFLIAESPRWLLVKHGVGAANDALRVVAQKNGKSHMLHTFELRPPPTGSETLANTPFKEEEHEAQRKQDGTLDLCCHSMIRVRLVVTLTLWYSIAFSYYGLILRSVSLPGDVFTNNAIGLAVELPATLAAIWLLDCLGRKKTTLALFLILGGGSYCVLLWTSDFGRLFLNLAGRATSGAGFAAVYLWSSELFPTSLRHSAMGLGSMSARIGSVLAPFAARLGDLLPVPPAFAADVPLLMFGTTAVVAGVIGMCVLPETRGLTSPETVADMVARAPTLIGRRQGQCCGRG